MVRTEVYQPNRVELSSKVKMPLSFVPEAGKRLVSPERKGIAGHELNHALVAIGNGVSVINISLAPMGDSLARTMLGGWVSIGAISDIAAAGGVGTHDGCARGYGSDKFRVDYSHVFEGGPSWESAKGRAAGILSIYSDKVREKAAEIIAYMGEVSGSLIRLIMLRAQMEVDLEKGMAIEPEAYILIPTPQKEFKDYTIIDTLPGNMLRVTYKVVGEKKKEELLCRICLGVDGHYEKCPHAKLKNDSELKEESSPKESLPIKGVIFSSVVLKTLRLGV